MTAVFDLAGFNPIESVKQFHYTRSLPSGKTRCYVFETAVVVFAIPANCNISHWLLGEPNIVWELSRLWAPDGHDRNLLTKAISASVNKFRRDEPSCRGLISYADPNAGHTGGVYRAASWVFLGQCEETRYYRDMAGRVVSRRAFHSGSKGLSKREIVGRGFVEERMPGKLRFAFGLDRRAKRIIAEKAAA